MGVYKHRNFWRAEVYFNSKKVKTKSGFKSKRDARKWLNIQQGLYSIKDRSVMNINKFTFEDLLNRFNSVHMSNISSGTASRYEIDLRLRIIPFFQFYELEKINHIEVEDFKANISKKLSKKSVNNCLGLLKTILKKGVEWKMIDSNPAQNINFNKLPQLKTNWWQNENDIVRFLESARKCEHHLAYRLGLDFGMRLGEIIGLSKSDISLSRLQIHIHRQWLDKYNRYGPPKHRRERFLGFSKESEIYELLQNALNKNPGTDILFLNSRGNRLTGGKLSSYYFQRIIKISNVPRIRFHDLRHTFASWFMTKQDNIWELKGLLGHADIQTTQRYAHLSSRHQSAPDFKWSYQKEA